MIRFVLVFSAFDPGFGIFVKFETVGKGNIGAPIWKLYDQVGRRGKTII